MLKQDIHGAWIKHVKEGIGLYFKQKPLAFFFSYAVLFSSSEKYCEKKNVQEELISMKTYAIIIAPIIEELLYTGILNHALGEKYGPILTPLIFGAMHLIQPICTKEFKRQNCVNWLTTVFQATILSYVNTRNTYTTQSLAPSIIHHILNNGVGILMMALSQLQPKL